MLGDLGYVQKCSSKPWLYSAHIEYVTIEPAISGKISHFNAQLSRETSKTFYCFMKFLINAANTTLAFTLRSYIILLIVVICKYC